MLSPFLYIAFEPIINQHNSITLIDPLQLIVDHANWTSLILEPHLTPVMTPVHQLWHKLWHPIMTLAMTDTSYDTNYENTFVLLWYMRACVFRARDEHRSNQLFLYISACSCVNCALRLVCHEPVCEDITVVHVNSILNELVHLNKLLCLHDY